MKNIMIKSMLTAAITMFCHNTIAMVMPSIYIENHYGTDVEYKTELSRVNVPSHILHNQERHELGKMGRVLFLSLKSQRRGSSFTDLPNILSLIMLEKDSHPNKNAVIIIKPSGFYQKWDVSLNWESIGAEVISLDNPAVSIIRNALGNDYARKAEEILEYDYTKATSQGFVDLGKSLAMAVENVGKQTFTKSPGRKNMWIAPEESTLQDLKDTIDQLFRALQRYKTRDNQ